MKNRSLAAALAALASLSGCTRDLELPGASAFTVAASTTTVAPRQTATITATGGSGGAASLTFAFDAGGKLSGDDAAITSNGDGTATYQAGQNGSTQDTLAVTDAAGAVRLVIMTVGARLTLTPQVGATAPGGTLLFAASGGKSPYVFSTTGRSVTPEGSGTSARYVAGTTGDTEETVTVTDATNDPAAFATATIQVGTALRLYRPTTGPVAPNETVTLVAFGGRGPYAFSPVCAGPLPQATGCFASPLEPVFTLGSAWTLGLIATATVTDANGETASVGLPVGPPLVGELSNPLVRPGVATRILASGGKPPYAFRFARHGNHSGGEVDAVSGTYVPGASPGALDRLEVEDATGTVGAVAAVAPVGPVEIATGRDGDRCVAGDYDGDGTEDLAFLFRGMRLLEVNRVADPDPLYRSYYVGTGFQFPAAWASDNDRNGRAELIFGGARNDGPVISGSRPGFWGLVPDMTGLFDSPNNLMVTWLLGGQAAVWRDPTDTVTRYVGSGFGTGSGACTGVTLEMAVWQDGMGGPGVTTLCTPPIANTAVLGSATALLFADLDADADRDLVWLAAAAPDDALYANTWNTPGPLFVRRNDGASFADLGSLALPLVGGLRPTIYEGLGDGEQNRIQRVPPALGSTAEGVIVRLREEGSGRGFLAFASGSPLAWRWGGMPFDPFQGGGLGTEAIAVFTPYPGGPPLVAAFAGSSIAVFDPWAPDPALAMGTGSSQIPLSFGCAVDADADGFPDLAMGGSGSDLAVVAWGNGWGGFGTRPRLATGVVGGVGGDLDGDGLVDVVTWDGTALSAMFGDAGQLGWGEAPITSLPIASVAVGPYVPYLDRARDSVIFQTLVGDYFLVRTRADGTFQTATSLVVDSSPQPNVPRVPHPFLINADLGGYPEIPVPKDGPGPDLIAPEGDNYGHAWIHVLIRPDADATLKEHVSPVVGDYRFNVPAGGIVKTHTCAWAPVSDAGGNHAVASLCAYEVVAGQRAAEWRVRGWPIDWAKAGWYDAPWKDVGTYVGGHAGAAGTESTVAALGEFGGKAWFLVATNRLELVVVDPGAGTSAALDPSGWTATATPITSTRHVTPYTAQLVDLDGVGGLDAVVGGEGTTVVLLNTGTATAPSFAFGYEVRAAGFPAAAGALGFSDAAGTIPAPPSVVLAGPRGRHFQIVDTVGGSLR